MLHSVCSSCLSTFRESLSVLFSRVKQSYIAWHPETATASNTARPNTETPDFYPAFHIYCPILVKWGIVCCTYCGQTVVRFVKIESGKIVLCENKLYKAVHCPRYVAQCTTYVAAVVVIITKSSKRGAAIVQSRRYQYLNKKPQQ